MVGFSSLLIFLVFLPLLFGRILSQRTFPCNSWKVTFLDVKVIGLIDILLALVLFLELVVLQVVLVTIADSSKPTEQNSAIWGAS
jgi:hypothetical protein